MENSFFMDIISKGNLGAYLQERQVDKLFWPDFFPKADTMFLSYQTIIGSQKAPVAADIVAYDTSAPMKTRQTVGKLTGDIPPIRVKRIMSESDINKYNQLKAMNIAGTPGADSRKSQILKLVYDDVDFTYKAVRARLEWLALKILSYPALTLTKTTNNGIVTADSIDFQMASANKKYASVVWSATASTTKPITDLIACVAAGKLLGIRFKYACMDPTSFTYFKTSDETKDYCYGTLFGTAKVKLTPTLAQVNEMLYAQGLPQIIVVDTTIITETGAGVQTAANPWTTGYVTLIPDLAVGEMLFGPIAEETNPPKHFTQAKQEGILVSKWSTGDPVAELTKSETNAFPSWTRVDECFSLYTLSASAWA